MPENETPTKLALHSRFTTTMKMKALRHLAFGFALAVALTGCASVDYQAYEGRDNRYEGQGGTKVTVDGVDFWANGSPPRSFTILGVATSEIGSGAFDEDLIRSAVAGEVKAKGGDAAIEMSSSEQFAGVMQLSPTLYSAANRKRMRFTVVKYLD